MGAFIDWMSGGFSSRSVRIDPERTVLVSDYEPTLESVTFPISVPPRFIVLPDDPERPIPNVRYHRFQPNSNPINWDDSIDDAIRAGANTVLFLIPHYEVRGQTLLRLHQLGIRRVLMPVKGHLRSYSPLLFALWRKITALTGNLFGTMGSQEQARGMEQIARAVLQMEQVTQRTAASAEESASAGTDLNNHANALRALVHEMRDMVGAGE